MVHSLPPAVNVDSRLPSSVPSHLRSADSSRCFPTPAQRPVDSAPRNSNVTTGSSLNVSDMLYSDLPCSLPSHPDALNSPPEFPRSSSQIVHDSNVGSSLYNDLYGMSGRQKLHDAFLSASLLSRADTTDGIAFSPLARGERSTGLAPISQTNSAQASFKYLDITLPSLPPAQPPRPGSLSNSGAQAITTTTPSSQFSSLPVVEQPYGEGQQPSILEAATDFDLQESFVLDISRLEDSSTRVSQLPASSQRELEPNTHSIDTYKPSPISVTPAEEPSISLVLPTSLSIGTANPSSPNPKSSLPPAPSLKTSLPSANSSIPSANIDTYMRDDNPVVSDVDPLPASHNTQPEEALASDLSDPILDFTTLSADKIKDATGKAVSAHSARDDGSIWRAAREAQRFLEKISSRDDGIQLSPIEEFSTDDISPAEVDQTHLPSSALQDVSVGGSGASARNSGQFRDISQHDADMNENNAYTQAAQPLSTADFDESGWLYGLNSHINAEAQAESHEKLSARDDLVNEALVDMGMTSGEEENKASLLSLYLLASSRQTPVISVASQIEALSPPGLSFKRPCPSFHEAAGDEHEILYIDQSRPGTGPPRKRRRIERTSLQKVIPEVRFPSVTLFVL